MAALTRLYTYTPTTPLSYVADDIDAILTRLNGLWDGTTLTADGGAVFNNSGANVDFRVASDTLTHAFFVKGSNGRVGINASSPNFPLEVIGSGGVIMATGSANAEIRVGALNTDTAGVNATARLRASANDAALVDINAHGAGRTATRYGITLASWMEIVTTAGNGLLIGTGTDAKPIVFGTNSAERLRLWSDGNVSLWGSASTGFGSGTQVIFMANRTAAPSSNPTGGGFLYAESGALKWRGSGGTVTTIAPA